MGISELTCPNNSWFLPLRYLSSSLVHFSPIIYPVPQDKNLEVTLGSSLSLTSHFDSWSFVGATPQIQPKSNHLSLSPLFKLQSPCLNFSKRLLNDLSASILFFLVPILHRAARMIYSKPKSDHVTLQLKTLQWLLIPLGSIQTPHSLEGPT